MSPVRSSDQEKQGCAIFGVVLMTCFASVVAWVCGEFVHAYFQGGMFSQAPFIHTFAIILISIFAGLSQLVAARNQFLPPALRIVAGSIGVLDLLGASAIIGLFYLHLVV